MTKETKIANNRIADSLIHNTVAVIISANTEWKFVAEHFAGSEFETTPYGEHFAIELNGETIYFFRGGWGKIDAAASAQYIIDAYSPELVINLGTCGGFAGHAQVEEIILAEQTIVYDIYERMSDPEQAVRAFSTEIDLSWVEEIPGRPVTRSVLISGDQDLDPQAVESLHTEYQAIAGDWESGAIAHVCKRNGTPILIARAVSDLVSAEGGEAYQAVEIFVRRTEKIMQTLLGLLPRWIQMYRRLER